MILILFIAGYASGQEKEINTLFKKFQSADWETVAKAKENLENYEGNCIHGLVALLKVNSVKKLENTGDLIYPGAERFFGHGQIIDYDIDKIDIRAGWLLEDLTFQNFGFTGIHLESSALVNYIKFNFPKYYNNSKNRQMVEKATDKEKRDIIRKLSIQQAEAWWDAEEEGWNRLNALTEALNSTDEKRQAKALFYIRNGKTKCTGLTEESYEEKIKPVIIELSKSPLKRISEQSKLILLDTDFDWLALKPSSD